MVISFAELNALRQEGLPYRLIAERLGEKYGIQVHAGSVYRALLLRRDLQVKDKNRFVPHWRHLSDPLWIYKTADKIAAEVFPWGSDPWEDLRDFLINTAYRLCPKEDRGEKALKVYLYRALKRAVSGHYERLHGRQGTFGTCQER